jgi:hypothetical protein
MQWRALQVQRARPAGIAALASGAAIGRRRCCWCFSNFDWHVVHARSGVSGPIFTKVHAHGNYENHQDAERISLEKHKTIAWF